MMFKLSKWYGDCVASDGTVFVGYAARASFGPIPLSYHALLWCPPEGEATSALTMAPAPLPSLSEEGVQWHNRRLGVRATWRGALRPTGLVLLDTPALGVEWRCHLPAGHASVTTELGAIEGAGYAEELLLRGNPAKLPIRELHWGRFTSSHASVVWIQWRGPRPLLLVLLDGVEVSATRADERRVCFAGGEVTFADRRLLREEPVARSVFGASEWRQRLLPGAVGQWQEEKWLSRGHLDRVGRRGEDGWVVHERVTFR